jgi:hypothetical protein
MARTCSCTGVCNCIVLSGDGIEVTGVGTAVDPYVVAAIRDTVVQGSDTTTVSVQVVGSGIEADPYIVSADATVRMTDLVDVDDPDGPPDDGDVPVWNSDHWEFAPPPTVPPGAVNVGAGLIGDGSSPNPLTVAVSGQWGVAPLDDLGPDSTIGAPIYVDSAGNLRAWAGDATVAWADILDKPTTFPSTWNDVTGKPTTFPPSAHSHDRLISPNGTQTLILSNTALASETAFANNEPAIGFGSSNVRLMTVRPNGLFGSLGAQIPYGMIGPWPAGKDRTLYQSTIPPTSGAGVVGDLWFMY